MRVTIYSQPRPRVPKMPASRRTWIAILFCLTFVVLRTGYILAGWQNPAPQPRRNVIIFVADGLRPGSVNAEDTPALWSVKHHGVDFTNSHSLFPTFTTANASAIATGHGLGDTGDFSNTIWAGYPVFESGNFNLGAGTPTPFIENDRILADLADHYNGNYLHETTLMYAARDNGYNTASIGKLGPAAIQQLEAIAPAQRRFPPPGAVLIIDDATGTAAGPPLPPLVAQGLLKAGLSLDAPERNNGYGAASPGNNGYAGNARQTGTNRPNLVQQQWFADVTTRVVLPAFQQDTPKPFLLLYWSRDPDGTQHNQGDASLTLYPGINGETSRLAVQNADRNLKQILEWLDANPAVKANTDVFITSDHGFATISRQEITRTGRKTDSEAAKHYYLDAAGIIETDIGRLPYGFLAIDLALGLRMNLFDPDAPSAGGIRMPYRQVRLLPGQFEHPQKGNGLLGDVVEKLDGSDARVIVTANGGSDLIYVPDKNPDTVRQVVGLLTNFDYTGAVFVDDQYGSIPGSLPLSAAGLVGASPMPRPAVVVAFKVFYLDPGNLQTAVQISDRSEQEGQGMHGGIGRDSTLNFMAAAGPDFKSGFVDDSPVGNADIAPTIAHILGMEIPSKGTLKGRVILEAMQNGPAKTPSTSNHIMSPEARGLRTVLHFQEASGVRYVDRACFIAVDGKGAATECP
jgi:arylsulfatase A-like enzyme